MTFKTEIFDIAREVAAQKNGWTLSSAGDFVNKSLKHTDLIVSPGFTFTSASSCTVQPFAGVRNKKIVKLFKEILGRDPFWTLSIKFQLESEKYRGPSSVQQIYREKGSFAGVRGEVDAWPQSFIAKEEAFDYLLGVLDDGIGFINKYFDLSSEEAFLINLPVTYQWMDKGVGNTGQMGSFYEQVHGIVHCLAAIARGDFDFVERYGGEEFLTSTPKRTQDVEKIIAALPELKRRFFK